MQEKMQITPTQKDDPKVNPIEILIRKWKLQNK